MQKGLLNYPSVRFIMKISSLMLIVQFTFISVLMASNVNGQNLDVSRISINLKHASIKESLLFIEKISNIHFSMQDELINTVTKKVTINSNSITIRQAIDEVLVNTQLQYKIVNNFIVISKKPIPPPPPPAGSIKGRVVDFETSESLPGATVQIIGTNFGTATDVRGYYTINNIPIGKYTIKASFVGFETATFPNVEIKSGQEFSFDIKLKAGGALNEVVIKGTKRRLQRAAVSYSTDKDLTLFMKSSLSVISGISNEQISKSVDRNAAEIVKRISGVTVADDKFIVIRGMNPRYNITYLNDNLAPITEQYQRAFSYDLIPTRIVDRILVYKSPAPELQGNFAGGAVKIYTKDAKLVKHLDVNLILSDRAGTTFKDGLSYAGSGTDWLGFDNVKRKLPSQVPGFGQPVNQSISQSTYVKAFNPDLSYGYRKAVPDLEFTANYFDSWKLGKHRLSDLTSLSYKHNTFNYEQYRQLGNTNFSENGNATTDRIYHENYGTETAQVSLLQNFIYSLKDSSKIEFKNFLLQQGINTTVVRISTPNDFSVSNGGTGFIFPEQKSDILSYSQRFLYAGNLTGTHYLGAAAKRRKLQWNLGYTSTVLDLPDQRVSNFTLNNRKNNIGQPGTYPVGGQYEDTTLAWTANTGNTAKQLTTGAVSRLFIHNAEKGYNGSVDYEARINPWLLFRAGTFQSFRSRVVQRRIFVLNEGDLSGNDATDQVLIPGSGGYIDPNTIYFREQDLPNVWSNQYIRNDQSGLKVYDKTSPVDAYTATERNNSGYAAALLQLMHQKLDIYGGIRVEYDLIELAGAQAAVQPLQLSIPVFVNLPKTNYLPSLNIGYRPSSSFIFRGSYGRTVDRPEFKEISPFIDFDYINNEQVAGNPLLISSTIDNYDFRTEFYPKSSAGNESISVGLFYKNLKNPIERSRYQSTFDDGQFPIITYQNTAQAYVRGIEVEFRKSLSFIPGKVFRNLSVVFNGSFIKSHAMMDSIQLTHARHDSNFTYNDPKLADRPLQGQAPYIINIALFYENPASGTKVSLSYNAAGTRIYAAGSSRTLQSSYLKMHPHYTPEQGSILELPRQLVDASISQRIYKSLQFKFSLQNLLNKPVQYAQDQMGNDKYVKEHVTSTGIVGDNLYQDYNPGRYYQFSFTYSF